MNCVSLLIVVGIVEYTVFGPPAPTINNNCLKHISQNGCQPVCSQLVNSSNLASSLSKPIAELAYLRTPALHMYMYMCVSNVSPSLVSKIIHCVLIYYLFIITGAQFSPSTDQLDSLQGSPSMG